MSRLMHRLGWWASCHSSWWLAAFAFRYCCPSPAKTGQYSARTCYEAGDCGCDNAERFR